MFILKKNWVTILLALFTCIGAFLHFYNLNWGSPWYFHPDERNIASSVTQLLYPKQMNPHFFAYGSLPIYTIYFVGVAVNCISQLLLFLLHPTSQLSTLNSQLSIFSVSFSQAIIISRFFSAMYATLLIPIVFVITNTICKRRLPFDHSNNVSLFAAFFTTFSVGLIQFAHFGTFEMWLTFWTAIMFWLCLITIEKHSDYSALLLGVVFGLLIATKVSHLAFLPLPLIAFLVNHFKDIRLTRSHFLTSLRATKLPKRFSNVTGDILILCSIALSVYFVTNPYVLLDYPSFSSSMNYESSVALGTELVFYSGEFVGTIPIVFQFLHVFPFLLNPLLTILFIPCFFIVCWQIIKNRNPCYLLLATCYLLLLLSQAFFYVKWTRYMLPTLPFMYVTICISIMSFIHSIDRNIRGAVQNVLFVTMITVSMLFSLSYFITAFIEPDSRIAAEQFAEKHVPREAIILSEVYDLGITPFNPTYHHISLFNFYDLDNHSPDMTPQALHQKLDLSEYVILPSQRILKTRLVDPTAYPNGYVFYHTLTTGGIGYKKIYQTPCNIFCEITYLGSPVFRYEETANVFDRPEVYIFKKE